MQADPAILGMPSMGTQQDFNHSSTTLAVDEEWQIISNDWWHTSFSSVSWSYQPEEGLSNLSFAKPPHYHRSLFKQTLHVVSARDDDVEEDSRFSTEWCSPASGPRGYDFISEKGRDGLNEELIGVKSARQLIDMYENVVGFDCSSGPSPEPHDRRYREIALPITDLDVALGRERWKASVKNLTGDFHLDHLLKVKHGMGAAAYKNDLCGGEPALAYSDHVIRSESTPSKPSRLNPSASSFIPLGSPISSLSSCSSLSSDTSERVSESSLSNQPLSVLQNEDNNPRNRSPSHLRTTSDTSEYSAKNERLSNAFLPTFLLERSSSRRKASRSSQTRAIVDRLRLQYRQDSTQSLPTSIRSSPTKSEFGSGTTISRPRSSVSEGGALRNSPDPCSALSSSVMEDKYYHKTNGSLDSNDCEDGWTLPTPASTPMSVEFEVKRNRSRELLRTLRRRTESLPSNPVTACLPMPANRPLGTFTPVPTICKVERPVLSPRPLLNAGADHHHLRLQTREDEIVEDVCPDEKASLVDTTLPCQTTTVAQARISNTVAQMPSVIKPDKASSNALPLRKADHQHDQSDTDNPSSCKSHSNDTLNYSHNTFHHKPINKYPFPGYYTAYTGPAYAFPSIPLAFPAVPHNFSMYGLMPIPVAASNQVLRYSTLMHLHVMQQMQQIRLLRNAGSGK